MQLPQDFRAAVQRHRAKLAPSHDNSFILSDTPAPKPAWQIFEVPHRDVARATIRLRLSMRPIEGGDAMFALHQLPGVEIALIGRDGALVSSSPEAVKAFAAEKDADGWLKLDLLYVNKGPSIVLGLAKPHSRYVGTNTPQLELQDLAIEVVEPRWTPSAIDPLRVVEAGLQTLPDRGWQPFAEGLNIVAFAPTADQLEAAKKALSGSAGHVAIGKALSDRNGASPYHITRNASFSSIFKPDLPRLKGYPSADGYQIASEVKIETCRFDSIAKQAGIQVPDVIRVEAPGLEYNVLRGFGALLDDVLAVETSIYLYPVYKKQKLLGDIVDLLESSGLVLRRLAPPASIRTQFDNELVKMTGIFMRKHTSAEAVGRYHLLEEIWGLPSSF